MLLKRANEKVAQNIFTQKSSPYAVINKFIAESVSAAKASYLLKIKALKIKLEMMFFATRLDVVRSENMTRDREWSFEKVPEVHEATLWRHEVLQDLFNERIFRRSSRFKGNTIADLKTQESWVNENLEGHARSMMSRLESEGFEVTPDHRAIWNKYIQRVMGGRVTEKELQSNQHRYNQHYDDWPK